MRHADPNLLQAYCWYAVNLRPNWSPCAAPASSAEFLGAITRGHWNRMNNGDCSVNVYWACSTTVATPIPAAKRRSSPKGLAGIRCDFDRVPRARFGVAAFTDIRWHLWIAGT